MLERMDAVGGPAVSANGWRFPAAKFSGVVFLPPQDFAGAIDLAVELRLVAVDFRLVGGKHLK